MAAGVTATEWIEPKIKLSSILAQIFDLDCILSPLQKITAYNNCELQPLQASRARAYWRN
jgi:hypothetical protein